MKKMNKWNQHPKVKCLKIKQKLVKTQVLFVPGGDLHTATETCSGYLIIDSAVYFCCYAGLLVSASTITTSSESSQTPVQTLLSKRSADVWHQGLLLKFDIPSSLLFLVRYSMVSKSIGRPDASSKRRDLAVIAVWANRLGTSGVETDEEIGLRPSASHLSPKLSVPRGSTCSLFQIWSCCNDKFLL